MNECNDDAEGVRSVRVHRTSRLLGPSSQQSAKCQTKITSQLSTCFEKSEPRNKIHKISNTFCRKLNIKFHIKVVVISGMLDDNDYIDRVQRIVGTRSTVQLFTPEVYNVRQDFQTGSPCLPI